MPRSFGKNKMQARKNTEPTVEKVKLCFSKPREFKKLCKRVTIPIKGSKATEAVSKFPAKGL